MLYTIENDQLKAVIDSVGCQVISLIGKKDQTEYVWNGDAAYWTGHTPILFPICGRLQDGKYTYQGKTYEMKLHGFFRFEEMQLLNCSGNSISMLLKDNEALYAQYPFHFEAVLTHTLDGDTLHTSLEVKNTGCDEMIFAAGGHPGFNIPMKNEGCFEDYYVEFDEPCAPQKLIFSEACLMTDGLEPLMLEQNKILHLQHSLFDQDAIFMKDMAKGVTLKSSASGKAVHMAYEDMQYLGFWHAPKTEAPYMCIEPWTSLPSYDGKVDDLDTKRDMYRLPSGQSRTISYTITITQ